MLKSKKVFYAGAVALAFCSAAILASCNKKDKTTTATEDTGYASDHATAEKSYNDAESISDQASTVSSGSTIAYKTTALTSACATVTRTTGSIIIDFGTTNCLCNDGRYRRGQILVNYTGNYSDSGSVRTITFNNYYQNDNKIDGTKTVTNMGHNTLGQPYYNVTVAGVVTLASGGIVTTSWTRIRTWTDGYATPTDFSDDKYSITGAGSITRANGTVVAVSIDPSTPLVMAAGCRWIESGTMVFTLPTGLTRTINYGSTASCDNQAVLTTPAGVTYNITLP